MKLLVAIPAFNEEKSISSVIRSIPPVISEITEINIVVFNDGSTDRTTEQAQTAGARVISRQDNRGLSYTFQEIVQESLKQNADILVNIDADGQFNASDIPKLVQPIIDGQADAVTASRFIDQRITPAMPVMKRWGNTMVARLVSFLTQQRFYDVSCGFRAYSREAFLHLNLFSKFTYTHETFLNIAFKGLRIWEIPVVVRGEREFGQSKVAHSLWRYGYNMVNTIFRTMLDYKPLKFFGWGGGFVFLIGVVFEIFVLIHWIGTGEISPYKSFGFAGLFLNLFGVLMLIVGLLADMINRVRLTQERILYYEKKRSFRS
ncbi:MAG: glycosyltransferase family 2 protein [Patescibacteria group bacterium]